MKTPFQEFQARFLRRLLDGWPGTAPVPLRGIPKALARRALGAFHDSREMPDAELTPEIAALRRAIQESMEKAFASFVEMGKSLLPFKEQMKEEDFWRLAQRELKMPREDIELAMQAAREAS